MELGNVAVGPEANLVLKLEDGKVKVMLKYAGADVEADLGVALKPDAFVAKLKEMIPGKVDDMVFDLILAQLK